MSASAASARLYKQQLAEAQRLAAGAEEVAAKWREAQAECAELRKRVILASEERDRAARALERQRVRADAAEAAVDRERAAREEALAQVTEAKHVAVKMRARLEAADAECVAVGGERDASAQALSDLKAEFAAREAAVSAAATTALEAAETRLRQRDDAQRQVRELELTLDSTRQELEGASKAVAKLQTAAKEQAAAVTAAQDEAAASARQCEREKEGQARALSQVEELREEAAQLRAQLHTAQLEAHSQRLKAAQSQDGAAASEVAAAAGEVAKARGEWEQARVERANALAGLDRATTDAAEAKAEADMERERRRAAQAHAEALEAKVAELQSEVSMHRSALVMGVDFGGGGGAGGDGDGGGGGGGGEHGGDGAHAASARRGGGHLRSHRSSDRRRRPSADGHYTGADRRTQGHAPTPGAVFGASGDPLVAATPAPTGADASFFAGYTTGATAFGVPQPGSGLFRAPGWSAGPVAATASFGATLPPPSTPLGAQTRPTSPLSAAFAEAVSYLEGGTPARRRVNYGGGGAADATTSSGGLRF